MLSASFWDMQFKDIINSLILIATIFAIYYGPIRAVKITRDNDALRERRKRQFDIFSNLMKTRKVNLDPIHVTALNLVEVEFHDEQNISTAYRAYIRHLYKDTSTQNPAEAERHGRDREDLLFDLIHAIGVFLGYGYDKRDLQKFAYAPQGWQNIENEQQLFRRLTIELLNGNRALPVKPFTPPSDKFPPPPA